MATSSAKSVDRVRQRIDDEIISLQESILALKSRRNALAPISRLPPETLAEIFSLLPSSWNKQVGHLARIRVAHVCSRWRETALNHSLLWSHIDFNMLTPAGMAEFLTRAKMTPLHLEATVTENMEQCDAFNRQLEPHIFHTRHLRIRGDLRYVLRGLVSSAPTMESLSLIQFDLPLVVIPIDIFNCTTPSLTSLELEFCNISWKSPLLNGLRTLKIELLETSTDARPKLED